MPFLLNLLLRAVLLVAGLILAASLAVAFVLLLAAWGVRAVWAKLTGQPVAPFVMHMYPRDAFEQMMRRGERASRTPRADAAGMGRRPGEVTDVEPK